MQDEDIDFCAENLRYALKKYEYRPEPGKLGNQFVDRIISSRTWLVAVARASSSSLLNAHTSPHSVEIS